jgi:hypothetical protein
MTTTTQVLRTNQMEFCSWIYDEGRRDPNHTNFSRQFLRHVAWKHGMAWAPAWIVKDKTRITSRGIYSVPEFAIYINSLITTSTANTTTSDAI